MTKEELREKRNLAIENLNHAIAILGSDELYIDELEQENAELKETCNKWFEHLKNREEELLNELYNQNAKYESQIEELEKENAGLKAVERMALYSRMSDRLAKAKEIIKTFLGFAEAFGYSPSMDKFISEAEQFLKEVEK